MPTILEELRAEHRMLLARLDEARAVNLDRAALKKSLHHTKALFLAHVGKEELKFYPRLEKAAETDLRAQAVLSLFRADLEAVAKAVGEFFSRLDADGFGDDLEQAFTALASAFRSRIAKEENLLYPEFERLCGGPS